MHAVTFAGVEPSVVEATPGVLARLTAIGALLAAAESVGAAGRMLDDARAYAAERRQFGRTIGSYQALRHILADMYVRQASAWSTVLYAAAALDDELPDAQRTAAVAKAYVARAAREVAHGALQVFGGIAFTEEHQAHRFLRRIVVREQQFGDAAHHERELGRALAGCVRDRQARMTETGFNDPTAQRLERISTGADPDVVGPLLADVLYDPRWLDCDVALISGGKSNLTYRVACDAGEVILRRPPLGHILPTAHDMVREYRVLTALDGTAVPVPRTLHLGRRSCWRAVLRDGARGRAHLPQRAARRLRRGAGGAARDRRSARRRARRAAHRRPGRRRAGRVRPPGGLHGAPAAALVAAVGGVAGRGRCRRWTRCATSWSARCRRSASTRSCTATSGSTTPSCTPTRPGRIVAVLDWEMSTLGDPLTDLGALLAFWSEAGDDDVLTAARIVAPVTAAEGFPSRAEVIERYARATGFDVSDAAWYQAFAFFKLAVVCQGIAARAAGGAMVGSGFDDAQRLVAPLVDAGRHLLP